MKTKIVKKNRFILKNIIVNKFMRNGEKKTVEKILLKCIKSLQKEYCKDSKDLFKSSIINTAPVFLIHQRVLKKGKKRKVHREAPSFVSNYSNRVKNSISFIKKSLLSEKKLKGFFEVFSREIVKSSSVNSISVTKKVSVQNQVLLNKRYWSNFKW